MTVKEDLNKIFCEHRTVIGDNYGMTCCACGQRLEGYGYSADGGMHDDCVHKWWNVEDEEYSVCVYCGYEG